VASTLSVDYAEILELRPDGQSFLLCAGVGGEDGIHGRRAIVQAGRHSQAGYTLLVNEPVIVTDLSQEKRFSESSLVDSRVVSGMSCLIGDQEGNQSRVLEVHSLSKREFSEDDMKFLQTMANIVAYAIHRKNIEIQLQAMKDSLEDQVKDRTQALLHHQQRIRNLSSELILTEHRERRRIANELHDYLGQLLVVAKIEVCKLEDAGLSESISRIVTDIEDVLDKALKYTQDLIPQISPPVLYEFGLKGAIPWLAEKMARYNLHVTVTSQVDDQTLRLPESVSIILYHVLRELLFNVVKHAKTGEARIAITQDSPEFISFEVADRGSGFDVQSILGQDTRLQKFGLLNVQERMESLGGQCRIHSTEGEGTRILITVPVSTNRAAAAPDQNSSPLIQENVPRKQDGVIRVVLADDHSIFREGLRTLLEACPDIQVVGEAENGEQAITIVQTLHPDAVVMDINMPVMNGIEATRLIKNTLPLVYIIGLSMHSDQIVKNAFSDAGGDHYVTKGDSFNTFAEIIRDSQKGSMGTH
jgi:signal transduction histidine kinase/ActR/RegA family two-component response regulator